MVDCIDFVKMLSIRPIICARCWMNFLISFRMSFCTAAIVFYIFTTTNLHKYDWVLRWVLICARFVPSRSKLNWAHLTGVEHQLLAILSDPCHKSAKPLQVRFLRNQNKSIQVMPRNPKDLCEFANICYWVFRSYQHLTWLQIHI
jgi:hypothetical protein